MYPVLFRIGDFTVTTFGLMMFLAFVIGAWVMARQFEKRAMDPEIAWDMLLWLAVGGIVGAKLYYVALHPADLMANPLRELTNRGGLVWYGGFIGGVAALLWQTRRRGLPLAKVFDSTAPALAIAQATGRIGCFLVGDDYGRPTDSWVGVAFPEGYPPTTAGYFRSIGHDLPATIPDTAVLAVHPTQLYEAGLALILFAFLWKVSGSLRDGRLFALYLAGYAVIRFPIEFVRAKTDQFIFGLTTSQLMSILILLAAAFIWQRTAGQGGAGGDGEAGSVAKRDAAPARR